MSRPDVAVVHSPSGGDDIDEGRARAERTEGEALSLAYPSAPRGDPRAIRAPGRRGGRDIHPRTSEGGSRLVRDLPGDQRRAPLRDRRQPAAVHDAVDLQAVRLRAGDRRPRARRRAATDWRRAYGRRLQCHQPRIRQWSALQSDDQRGRDRGDARWSRVIHPTTRGRGCSPCCRPTPVVRSPSTRQSTNPSAAPDTATAPSATCCATSTSSPMIRSRRSICTSVNARSR